MAPAQYSPYCASPVSLVSMVSSATRNLWYGGSVTVMVCIFSAEPAAVEASFVQFWMRVWPTVSAGPSCLGSIVCVVFKRFILT